MVAYRVIGLAWPPMHLRGTVFTLTDTMHIVWATVTVLLITHFHHGVPHDTYFRGMARGRDRVLAEFGVELKWVFDIVRDAGDPLADYTTKVAIECKDDGVVALGLGGFEAGHPPERFARYFDLARMAGLHSTPHAGETAGPAGIWGALRALGAERIGHGVRAIEDPALVAELAARGVPLEINPTSNIRLGVYPTLAAHPLRRLHDAGVVITINSDDPALFDTTLNDEVATLANPFGFDVGTIDEILLNGVRHSFLPLERKQALEATFRSELDRLQTVHLAQQE